VIRCLLLLLALLSTPAAAQPVQVAVARAGDAFIAEFQLPRSAPAWGFFRSSVAAKDGKSFRLQSWQVLTPGVALQRRGKFDALVALDGRAVPARVRVRVTPFTGDLASNYVPALRLGGDSVALFDGHFSVFSVPAPAALDRLPASFDPRREGVGDSGTSVRFKGRGLRLAGDVEGYRAGRSEGTYGLFDVPRALVRNGVATVIDGDLPKWIADDLVSYSPRVMKTLANGLGPAGVTEPTILAAWEGVGREGASMNGGSLKGLILMRFEGQSALKPLPALTDLAHWFIAHEASHFWLGQSVHYATQRDSWIMEGGADLLAIRTVQRLNPAFDARSKLNEEIRECAGLAHGPVASAIERGEHRAYYACGAVFALVAEKANGGDFFAFTRRLVDVNRTEGVLTGDEWLAALSRLTGSRRSAGIIRGMVDRGARDPKGTLALLLREEKIPYVLDGNGVPQLQ
jgi:hypothetical protein